jgi:hypothetical protein
LYLIRDKACEALHCYQGYEVHGVKEEQGKKEKRIHEQGQAQELLTKDGGLYEYLAGIRGQVDHLSFKNLESKMLQNLKHVLSQEFWIREAQLV